MNIVEMFFNNSTTKSLAITALVAVSGWTANTLIGARNDASTLEQHGAWLQKLSEGQAQTQKDIGALVVSVTAVNGKIDVIGQKIDDDRAAKVASAAGPHRFGVPEPAAVPAETSRVVPPK